jgi:hypothetical protein
LVRIVIQKFAHRVSSLLQYKGRVNPSSHTNSKGPDSCEPNVAAEAATHKAFGRLV